MTENEALETYRELAKYLVKSGLQWVVREVDASVAGGRSESRRIRPAVEQTEDATNRRREGPPTAFQVRTSYSNADALRMLIDATELVVVDTAAMEESVFTALSGTRQAPKEIIFSPDDEAALLSGLQMSNDVQEYSITHAETLQRGPEARNLGKLLNELRNMIDDTE